MNGNEETTKPKGYFLATGHAHYEFSNKEALGAWNWKLVMYRLSALKSSLPYHVIIMKM